ncbi:uncharacterized protein EURHEDRAFT_305577 [Aspergillus ruber CBS 135680]|uniref:Uncharacterized protein n=1 Tax=Aspergillus ruber (strain CBS 135680) TaxID=1388766 RepID=A0A017SLW9_ASPRC|nr:uncharacterized protein EURHEDRAFT_305577 [Aspergillus ruber CBS 135680]EYE97776.1 hypothetical protein EURHEDRAFT_305577 [Aspergillus ruber CBS 135680]
MECRQQSTTKRQHHSSTGLQKNLRSISIRHLLATIQEWSVSSPCIVLKQKGIPRRTSSSGPRGRTRLSDYMLWQCCENTHLRFITCYLSEIRTWRLVLAVFNWRRGLSFYMCSPNPKP